MPEEKTIRLGQIEGLDDYIRQQVRAAIREEAKPALQDMEEIKRSPAGMLIKLEDKVDALGTKMDERFRGVDQRFEAVDQRFDALRGEMNQRFDALESKMDQRFKAVDQRFEAVDHRFEALRSELGQRFGAVDHRFDSLERRFSMLQWVVILIFPLLLAILGKLFLK